MRKKLIRSFRLVVGYQLSGKISMMDNYKRYTDLEVWNEARALTTFVYSETKTFPKDELFGLTNQMRRCAVSIPSNMAEGCGRNHTKDSLQFFHIARGSLYELETQL
jgi:23S rRNA-intervening sequence protein